MSALMVTIDEMSLGFVLGLAGSGKSTYIYKQILEDAAAHPEKDYIVVIPEQSSMNTQKALTDLARAHAILNIDVLSFNRLTYRVFTELSVPGGVLLDDTAKNLILRHILAEKKDDLAVLPAGVRKMGYVDEIKSLLTEFDEYCVTDEALMDAAEKRNTDSPCLSAKLKDLVRLRKAFRERCSASDNDFFVTGQGVMEKLTEVCHESEYLKGATIVFDCFTGFTPVQLNFVSALLRIAEKVFTVLTLDPDDLHGHYGNDDLFYITKNTYFKLRRLATENGVSVEEDLIMRELPRFSGDPELEFINRHFLRNDGAVYGRDFRNVLLHSFPDILSEVRFAAGEITGLTNKGMRYRDIAIVSPSSEYTSPVKKVFEEMGIPVFVDEKSPAGNVPLITLIKNLFSVKLRNFDIDTVMAYYRTGLLDVELREVDELENYLYAKGINKEYKWRRKWENDRFSALKECILGPLDMVSADDADTVEERTRALYTCLLELHTDKNLSARADRLEASGDVRRAQDYRSVWEALMKLFEKMLLHLGTEKVSFEEYADILCSGLESISVGSIPTSLDQVMYGDMTRSRAPEVKVLMVLGASAGAIPQVFNSGGLFSQAERTAILAGGLAIAPTDREKTLTSRFYLYNAFCRPKEKLYISYSLRNSDGSAAKRSYIISDMGLSDVFVGEQGLSGIADIADLRRYVCFGFRDAPGLNEEERIYFATALNVLLSDDENKRCVELAAEKNFLSKDCRRLSKQLLIRLFSGSLRGSVSNLETYASCACKFYFKYVLRLRERETAVFKNTDYGNLFHSAMENLGRRIMASPGAEIGTADILESFDTAGKEFEERGFFEEPEAAFFYSLMRKTYETAAESALHQLSCGDFSIAEVEKKFSETYESEEGRLILSGTIDRIDICPADGRLMLRVIDYKTGTREITLSDIYNGISLQLPVYLMEAGKLYKDRGETLIPAGLFYYRMDDPMISADIELDEYSARLEQRKVLAMSGAYNTDESVIGAMEHDEEDHVFKKKRDSNKLTTDEMNLMLKYVEKRVQKTADEIWNGDFSPRPIQRQKERTECGYCEYAAVCMFDPDGDDKYRRFKKIDDETVLEQMRKGIL